MYLYNLSLKKPTAINCVCCGSFSEKDSSEIVVAKGKILELYIQHLFDEDEDEDMSGSEEMQEEKALEDGKFSRLFSSEMFGNIRNIRKLRPVGIEKDYLLVSSDSGKMQVLEFVKKYSTETNCERIELRTVHSETYGKSGIRRIVPGEYLAVEPKGRAAMVAAVEKQKFVYIFNRNKENELTISSPLSAHKENTITFHLTELDVGFENPQFATIELNYEFLEGKENTEEELQKQLSIYELDLGLNHVVGKWKSKIPSSSHYLIPVPGGKYGPGGVLICFSGSVMYKNENHEDIIAKFPLPSPQLIPSSSNSSNAIPRDYSKLFIVAHSSYQKKKKFFFLLVNENAVIFKVELKLSKSNILGTQVDGIIISYFDTLPQTPNSIKILKSGYLFTTFPSRHHRLYHFLAIGKTNLQKTELFYRQNPLILSEYSKMENNQRIKQFSLKEQELSDSNNQKLSIINSPNLELVQQFPNFSPLIDFIPLDLLNLKFPQIYSINGTGLTGSYFSRFTNGFKINQVLNFKFSQSSNIIATKIWTLPGLPKKEVVENGGKYEIGKFLEKEKFIVLSLLNKALNLYSTMIFMIKDNNLIQLTKENLEILEKIGKKNQIKEKNDDTKDSKKEEYKYYDHFLKKQIKTIKVAWIKGTNGNNFKLVQVYNNGILIIGRNSVQHWTYSSASSSSSLKQENEICACDINSEAGQIIICTVSGELIYFESTASSSSFQLDEIYRVNLGERIHSLTFSPSFYANQRSRYLAISYYDKKIRVFSIDPSPNLFLKKIFFTQLFPDEIVSLQWFVPTKKEENNKKGNKGISNGGEEGLGRLVIGLKNGVIYHSKVEYGTCKLIELQSKVLGTSEIEIKIIKKSGITYLLCLTDSNNWLGFIDSFSSPGNSPKLTFKQIFSSLSSSIVEEQEKLVLQDIEGFESGEDKTSFVAIKKNKGELVIFKFLKNCIEEIKDNDHKDQSKKPTQEEEEEEEEEGEGEENDDNAEEGATMDLVVKRFAINEFWSCKQLKLFGTPRKLLMLDSSIKLAQNSRTKKFFLVVESENNIELIDRKEMEILGDKRGKKEDEMKKEDTMADETDDMEEDDMEIDDEETSKIGTTDVEETKTQNKEETETKRNSENESEGYVVRKLEENSGKWLSILRIIDPISMKTINCLNFSKIKEFSNLCITSISFAYFNSSSGSYSKKENDRYLVIGGALDLKLLPKRTSSSGILLVFKIIFNQKSSLEIIPEFKLVHKTLCPEIPNCLAYCQNKLLVGMNKFLRVYELGNKKLLLKSELREFSAPLASLKVVGNQIIIADSSHSLFYCIYNSKKNKVILVANSFLPRYLTSFEIVDHKQQLCGDKFGNIFMSKLPEDLELDNVIFKGLNENLKFSSFLFQKNPSLISNTVNTGGYQKSREITQFYTGDIVSKLRKINLFQFQKYQEGNKYLYNQPMTKSNLNIFQNEGNEVVMYSTILGAINLIIPLKSKTDYKFFKNLEEKILDVIESNPKLFGSCGNMWMKWRSSYSPISNTLDGDLIQIFNTHLTQQQKEKIADQLDLQVYQIEKRIKYFKLQAGII